MKPFVKKILPLPVLVILLTNMGCTGNDSANSYVYNGGEIEKLISVPLDKEVAIKLFGFDDDSLIETFNTDHNFVFEYEYFDFVFRFQGDGSIYLNEKLLYQDKEKVNKFMCKYARQGIFTTSAQTLFFRNYLKNREMRSLQKRSHNPPVHICLTIEGEVVFNEIFPIKNSEIDFPEARAIADMWIELRTFGPDGTNHWDLLR